MSIHHLLLRSLVSNTLCALVFSLLTIDANIDLGSPKCRFSQQTVQGQYRIVWWVTYVNYWPTLTKILFKGLFVISAWAEDHELPSSLLKLLWSATLHIILLYYNHVGIQEGKYCYCGATYGSVGKAPEGDCVTPCTGDGNEKCGGTLRNTIYRTNEATRTGM